ncbi:DNA mismatch repair protein MutL [Aneurinibacillus soli]|uniref:DNA mismatch repair protein MutL n=1 Tax=Aneurinibacillus soli TaxID=1500254 RepID=A0A0U4WJV9_9BACL|nr:DNA mismatch repair endonuclease MutL [Aneurinibacillus soli]PYE57396.1 DNA mismatch repair protein MutL [Aneurinibacillus soli]BAU28795.1 DNA mismatch repair protein MutL [Aneurinibacillus soli]
MADIQVMDAQLANLIAAGEVVERPASVVKELVENAIDACATRIEVHLEEGGLMSIRVVDNGRGMDSEDCCLAFERHATSKLIRERDLSHIRTLGFRGEALPSIAAVSRTEIKSTQAGSTGGTRIRIAGGVEEVVEPVAHPRGTEVHVTDLFYNTPARLKYMKTIHTEVGHVSDVMNRQALSHPGISFVLTHNDKQLLKTPGDGKLLHAIAAVYGMNIARSMIPIEAESLDYKLSGYLARPEITRAGRSYMSTIINGRYVRNHGVNNAILRGYHTLLPINRSPIAVLAIEMEPSLVDVNVHPAKLEVRFSKEQELYSFVEEEVRRAWSNERLIPEPGRTRSSEGPRTPKPPSFQASMDWSLFVPEQAETSELTTSAKPRQTSSPEDRQVATEQASRTGNLYSSYSAAQEYEQSLFATEPVVPVENSVQGSISIDNPSPDSIAEPGVPLAIDEPSDEEMDEMAEAEYEPDEAQSNEDQVEESPSTGERVPDMYPVGQVHGTYIIAQNADGMYMIDQHAAQERIFYEYFLNKLHEEAVESQDLLIPITLELTTAEAGAVEAHRDWFERIGVHLEPFGLNSFLVRSHPRWLPKGEEEAIIHEMVEMVVKPGRKGIDVVKLREAAAITMSCKAAIKANRHLNHAELEALIERLRRTTSPFTCPHGRPIIIHFSTYDIEKMFKRVM